jgi:ATP-dependent DNA ligase
VSFFETGAEQLLHPQFGPEGLVAKKADSVYQAGVRSADWVKIERT